MDAFVLPSYREGFPTVVLEASAMALPLIVSRSTGCIDSIIENQTGVYCDITPESIAEAVMTFADKEKAYRFGQAGRQFVLENFEHTKVKALMLDLLNDITSKRD
jgi:glycosyltransferase involved in cell wall biosynthesis